MEQRFYSRGFANSNGPYTKGNKLPPIIPVWDAKGTNEQDGGVLPYNQIVKLSTNDSTWGQIQNDGDPTASPPTGTGLAYINNQTNQFCLTFDNPKSIGYKVNLVKKYKLGGMLAWDNASDIRVRSTNRPIRTISITCWFINQCDNYRIDITN